jgi:hypothetical protein
MYIDSSNHIGLTNNNKELTTNIIFLNNNNCYDIITSDNIIIDGYDSETITTSENCVYLFGQDVYAKSFNTLK